MLIRKFKDLLIILKIQQEKTRGEFFFFLLEKSTQSFVFFWSCNVLALFLLISLIFDQILKYILYTTKQPQTQRIKKNSV